jgi:5-methyltetrahydrofolate--homocysteine methyltransferase
VGVLAEISERLLVGDDEAVSSLTEQAIADGLPPKQILDDGLIAGMNTVGEQFKNHEIFLPEVLLAARAMYAGMDQLKPLLLKEGIPSRGKVVLGSVQGDLHDIGKNLVGIMLKGAGFEVVDLGADVAPEKFIEAARAHDAAVIGMSALLTTTMPAMKTVIDRVAEEGLAGKVKVIVGGAPVSGDFAVEIGADAHGYDAANAVERVKALIGEN